MKLGILTDIHEHTDYLKLALTRFQQECVDQVVVIGDAFETGARITETCRLLQEVNAVGVWGNHDYGLCVEPDQATCQKYAHEVIQFMQSLLPRMQIHEVHFSHVEPWLDPNDVADLWYFEGPPDNPAKLARIFDSVPDRLIFTGHYHHWLAATPTGLLSWNGVETLSLTQGRFFIVIGALCEGRYAILNTDNCELTPFNDH